MSPSTLQPGPCPITIVPALPVVQPLAVVVPRLHGCLGAARLRQREVPRHVLQPPRAAQQQDELRQCAVVVGRALQQLLEVVDGGVVVLLGEGGVNGGYGTVRRVAW